MNVHDALAQITEIRQRMTWGLTFRGYRASTTALTAGIALAAAVLQGWLVRPASTDGFRIDHYLAVWLTAALLGASIVFGGFLIRRADQSAYSMHASLTVAAIESFLPCLVVGALITYVIAYYHRSSEAVGLLPGLWMILFSLGVFASRRLLPRPVFIAAGFYLLAGLYVMSLDDVDALSPWTMGTVFGTGQLLSAAILYLTLERPERAANGGPS